MATQDAPTDGNQPGIHTCSLGALSGKKGSEAEAFEAKISHLQRLASLGTFSASMVHEIRNALVSGRTYLQLLVEKHGTDEFSQVVMREFERMDVLLNQMLRFSASDRPDFGEVRVHEVLARSLLLVIPQLRERSIELRKNFGAEADFIPGDAHELEQAFVNLFLNGIEAMNRGGILTVDSRALPPAAEDLPGVSWMQVEISDSGVGIAEENIERLFEPFFTTKSNGTGLGLYITRRIIEHHHGSLGVRSKVREGTTFTLKLPLAKRKNVA
jgi:two-component system sporulation sensor kinase A